MGWQEMAEQAKRDARKDPQWRRLERLSWCLGGVVLMTIFLVTLAYA